MPEEQPWNVYREQLSPLHQGYALWEPEPVKGLYDKVSIGDVGYVDRGFFYRMFNVTLPWDNPSNNKFGEDEPEHYKPMTRKSFANIHATSFIEGDYYSPNVFRQKNADYMQAQTSRE
jgi:hypothetical protein